MTSNPLVRNTNWYRLTWSDLRSRMPYATDMQMYDAAERLTPLLNELFTQAERQMAFEYETALQTRSQANQQEPETEPDGP